MIAPSNLDLLERPSGSIFGDNPSGRAHRWTGRTAMKGTTTAWARRRSDRGALELLNDCTFGMATRQYGAAPHEDFRLHRLPVSRIGIPTSWSVIMGFSSYVLRFLDKCGGRFGSAYADAMRGVPVLELPSTIAYSRGSEMTSSTKFKILLALLSIVGWFFRENIFYLLMEGRLPAWVDAFR